MGERRPGPLTTRLTIEYHGAGFAGWAAQPGLRTVQGVLEQAVATARDEHTPLTVAGRTDSGVHARGQVASHAGAPVEVGRLNALLPGDVRVLASESAADGFDARRDARARLYRYGVLARRADSPLDRGHVLHWPHLVDRGALARCAEAVRGTHDFTAFTPTQTEHVRFERVVSRAEWTVAGNDVLELWIEADAFLRHMVRTLVGTMLEVATARRSEEQFIALLEGRPRAEAGITAPPHGLCLEAVRYEPAARRAGEEPRTGERS